MPKWYPSEFKRDVVMVARWGELAMAGVAADEACLTLRDRSGWDSGRIWGSLAGCCW